MRLPVWYERWHADRALVRDRERTDLETCTQGTDWPTIAAAVERARCIEIGEDPDAPRKLRPSWAHPAFDVSFCTPPPKAVEVDAITGAYYHQVREYSHRWGLSLQEAPPPSARMNPGLEHQRERLADLPRIESPAEPGAPSGHTGRFPTPSPDMTAQGSQVLVDYWGGTVPESDDLTPGDVARLYVGQELDNWVLPGRGGYGYSQRAEYGGVKLYWDGAPGMGIHLEASGEGCRTLEAHWREAGGWVRLWWCWREMGGTCSQVHLAIDDRDQELPLLDMDTIKRATYPAVGYEVQRKRKNGDEAYYENVTPNCVRTRLKNGADYRSFDGFTGQDTGPSVAWGYGGKSTTVIYDKDAEQVKKGADSVGHWIRVEQRLRDDLAEQCITCILATEDVPAVACGILRDKLAFVDPIEDKNYSRWPLSAWWSIFLCAAERLSLGFGRPPRTIERTRDWVWDSVAASLALLERAAGHVTIFNIFLAELLEHGAARLKDKHLMLLRPGFKLIPYLCPDDLMLASTC